MSRITFQGALRYDRAWSYFPEQEIIPVRFFPQGKTYPATEGSSYNDLTPRGGVAMDLFGNGKTSLKFSFGRYLEAAQNAGFFITNNPIGRLSTTVVAHVDGRQQRQGHRLQPAEPGGAESGDHWQHRHLRRRQSRTSAPT